MSKEDLSSQLLSRGIQEGSVLFSGLKSTIYSGFFNFRPCAIKIQRQSSGLPFEVMEREYEALLSFRHPALLELLDGFWTQSEDGKHYLVLVTEMCEADLSRDMRQRAGQRRPYSEQELLDLLRNLGMVLAFMQEHGCVHRDIKPDNIFRQGTVIKLGDLGSARFLEPEFLPYTLVGTPAYLSPLLRAGLTEQQAQVAHNAYKSDCYSLGVTMYALATLNPPVEFLSTDLHDEDSFRIIDKLRYSNRIKHAIWWLVRREEKDRCDFLELRSYLLTMQDEGQVDCMVCGKVMLRTEIAVDMVIALPCNPLDHLFCGAECMSLFLESVTPPFHCPKCFTEVPAEVISMYKKTKMTALKERGGKLIAGVTAKLGWLWSSS
jgi:serine/threonine protein kinase